MEGSTRFGRWWQSYGRDLVGCGVMTRACSRGELTVALLVGESHERRREAREMRKTERGSRFLLPTTCMSDAVAPYVHVNSQTVVGLWHRSATVELNRCLMW
jgi:hypothetical protein